VSKEKNLFSPKNECQNSLSVNVSLDMMLMVLTVNYFLTIS
jgi:hypothetical protein